MPLRAIPQRPLRALALATALFLLRLPLAGLLPGGAALADVPEDINLQGRLFDNAGDPMPGPVNITIRIWDQLSAGDLRYQEDHPGTALEDGTFDLLLGTGQSPIFSFDPDTFAESNVYLELVVDGDALEPRQPFSSVAYAFHSEQAGNAQSLQGFAAKHFSASDHHHDRVYASFLHPHPGYALDHHDHDSTYAASDHGHAEYASAGHDHAGAYAEPAHEHSASDITEGTLSTSRFDAYANLSDRGRLDDNSSNDLLTRGQLDARYEPLRTGSLYYQIPAYDFQLSSIQSEDEIWSASGAHGTILDGSGDLDVRVYHGVRLPDGARIDELVCYLRDNAADADIAEFDVTLVRLSDGYWGAALARLRDQATTGQSSILHTFTVTDAEGDIIENRYAHQLYVELRFSAIPHSYTDLGFRGCRIIYTP